MAPGFIMATDRTVELDQSPENVLGAIESATKAQIEKGEEQWLRQNNS